jgi:hypothetical protein
MHIAHVPVRCNYASSIDAQTYRFIVADVRVVYWLGGHPTRHAHVEEKQADDIEPQHRTTTAQHSTPTHPSKQGKRENYTNKAPPPPVISLPRVRVVHPKLLADCCIHIPVAFSEHLAVKHLDDRVGKLAPNSLRNDAM